VLEARALETRFAHALSAGHRRALTRIQSGDRSAAGAGWLAYRALRPLTGRDETMGMERGLLAGLLWARMARMRARIGQRGERRAR
jgi:hypothetical protein